MKKSRLEQSFDTAVEHHQAGRFTRGRGVILPRGAGQAAESCGCSLHLLGVMAGQLSRFDDAVNLSAKAVVLCPNIAGITAPHLGNALSEKKDYQLAIEQYRHASSTQAELRRLP